MGNIVSNLALEALCDPNGLKNYRLALSNACKSNPPPYGQAWFGNEFRFRARDYSWFASLLVSDADLEGYSARQLWAYAGAIDDLRFAAGLRRHAIDEARHSRIFARLLFLVFPRLDEEDLRLRLDAMAPELRLSDAQPSSTPLKCSREELLNSAILINLHEVKALVLEYLLRPTVIAYCDTPNERRANRLLGSLISDEIRHIRYSAEIIDAAMNDGYRNYVYDAMSDFQSLLNAATVEEVNTTPRPDAQCEF